MLHYYKHGTLQADINKGADQTARNTGWSVPLLLTYNKVAANYMCYVELKG